MQSNSWSMPMSEYESFKTLSNSTLNSSVANSLYIARRNLAKAIAAQLQENFLLEGINQDGLRRAFEPSHSQKGYVLRYALRSIEKDCHECAKEEVVPHTNLLDGIEDFIRSVNPASISVTAKSLTTYQEDEHADESDSTLTDSSWDDSEIQFGM